MELRSEFFRFDDSQKRQSVNCSGWERSGFKLERGNIVQTAIRSETSKGKAERGDPDQG
jgi:hypothetical protein